MSIQKQVQRLIFGDLNPDDLAPDRARRIRFIYTILIVMVTLGLPFIVRSVQWHIPVRIAGVGGAMCIALLLIFTNRNRRHLDAVGHFALLAFIWAVIPAIWTSGGFSGAAIGWLAMLPMMAGFMTGYLGAIFWGLMALVALLGFYTAEAMGIRFPDYTPAEYAPAQRLLQYGGILITAYFTVTSFLSSLRESESRFKKVIQHLKVEVNQRKKAEQDALYASAAKSQFLANISHELRTPLNGIIGMAQVALETPMTEAQQRHLQVIDESSHYLLRLINDVLDFSKIEADKLVLNQEPFLLDAVIANLAAIVAVRARAKNLNFYIDIDPDVPPVLQGDEIRLNQILANLLGNAVKFTEQGQVALHCTALSALGGELELRFEVTDTGIGMSADYVKTLFNAFSQADASITRTYGGTGLGLAISKRLLELMHGEVEVESQIGLGSRFILRIPFAEAQGTELAQAVADRYEAVALMCRAGRALVAVSDGALQRITTRLLRSFDMEVNGLPDFVDLTQVSQMFQEGDLLVIDDHLAHLATTLVERGNRCILQITDGAHPNPSLITHWVTTPTPLSRHSLVAALEKLQNQRLPQASQNMEATPLHNKCLLVVEDNLVNQEVARKILEKLGARVDVANNGEEAVHAVELRRYDAILMDVQMPGMDGLQATRAIRSKADFDAIPILAMSAHVEQSSVEACFEAGMCDHIPKPFRKQQLLDTLQRWL